MTENGGVGSKKGERGQKILAKKRRMRKRLPRNANEGTRMLDRGGEQGRDFSFRGHIFAFVKEKIEKSIEKIKKTLDKSPKLWYDIWVARRDG